MGNTAAAIAANILLQHCEAIESLIMCGIAGAVPNPAKPEHHVRLGDIVVSGPRGIVQYDYGKQRDPRPKEGAGSTTPDPFRGLEFRAPLRPPCAHLLATVERMHAAELLMSRSEDREWEAKITLFLEQVGEPKAWKRPAPKTDSLIDSPDGQGESTPHPKDDQRRRNWPRVFRGAIGAANIVLADPQRRDALRDRFDIRAVEMEGSGVADAGWVANVGYLVVRGTCDYCNATKNDDWPPYAALIAAAYTRTVIEHLHAEPISQPTAISATPFVSPIASALIEVPTAPSREGAVKVIAPAAAASRELLTPQSTVPLKGSPELSALSRESVSAESIRVPDPRTTFESAWQLSLSEDRRVQELIDQLTQLREKPLSHGTSAATSLELLLQQLPRRGVVVREGWLTLARREARRLHIEKAAGGTPDVTRLRILNQEAERVTD